MGNHKPLDNMNVRKRRPFPRTIFFLLLVLAALACDVGSLVKGDKPIAIITSPPSGSSFSEGDEIAVQSFSTDANGVARVELLVDGQIVRTDPVSVPQNQFSLIQIWQATPGTHTLVVRAYDIQNNASNPAAISLSIAQAGSSTPVASAPTATPSNGNASPSPSPSECINNAAFVADITVPDGSLFAANQSFNKIWRLRNTGTCAWGAGYQFVFSGGDALTTNTVVAVPNTLPGATADFLVPMNAPRDSGSHVGNWRLKTPGGTLFGQMVTVKITVPGPAPTAAAAPSGPCNGTPVITSFTVDSGLVTWGGKTNLRWGPVTNADSADIDQGVGDIAAGPEGGFAQVSPSQTTIYTLNAHCGTSTVQKTVTILVPFAITSVVGSVSPTSGACSQTFTFQFTISVNTAGTVYWKRERSDNAPDPAPGNYTFENPGSYNVNITWSSPAVSATHNYWIQLHTTSPTDVTSNQATFTCS